MSTGLTVAVLLKFGKWMVETVLWTSRLALSWFAPESHSHKSLHSLRRRVGLPQGHSKDGTSAAETQVCPIGAQISTDTGAGLEALSLSSGMHIGPSVSIGCLISLQWAWH